jgi:hypothetical protein
MKQYALCRNFVRGAGPEEFRGDFVVIRVLLSPLSK